MSETVLYDYWRSSASYRVRIALHAANIEFARDEVDLLRGEQSEPAHYARNPQGLVPALAIDGRTLTQSLAIIEYIDETRNVGFLPKDPAGRARVRTLAHAIAMDIHPICNTGTIAYLLKTADGGDAMRDDWMRHFIRKGLVAFEQLLDHPETGRFCHGDTPGLADFCLIPQLYNARRWRVDLGGLSRILAVEANSATLPAFQQAHPDRCKPV